MTNPIPLHPPGHNAANPRLYAGELCSDILNGCHGYILLGSDDPAAACAVAETIANIANDDSHPLVPHEPGRRVIDATPAGSRPNTACKLRRLPPPSGSALTPWRDQVLATSTKLVLAGPADRDRIHHLHALRDAQVPILVTMPMRSHASGLVDFVRLARDAGLDMPLASILETILIAGTTVPCQTCYGFWQQTPRNELIHHFGLPLVSIIETNTTEPDRAVIRTWRTNPACPACHGTNTRSFIYSRLPWLPPVHWLLSRGSPESVDDAVADGTLGATPLAQEALLTVVLGDAAPELLGHPAIRGQAHAARLAHDLLELIRETR